MGKFYNPIFVLTDKPNSTELDEYDVSLVDITQYKPKFETTAALEAWENASITKVKWFKTQLFHLIPATVEDKARTSSSPKFMQRTRIDNLLFIDADEIINGPLDHFGNSVTQSMLKRSSFKKSPDDVECSAYFFSERFYSSQSVNSGTALYFRRDSQTLLSEWSHKILSGKYELDQLALDATLQQHDHGDLKVCTFPARHNFFTSDFLTSVWNTLSFGRRRRGATFIHPTSYKDMNQMAIPYDRTAISNHRH